ncbi:MAG TPA: sigma-70 family RNA polymerase sigma factor [Plantibacter sp.]|uniref:RNA polymerase sigma factor n=1 Tax=unclassified Plantibacter TaxID=2624265 RepID=UPI002C6E4A34|nr:sigma-70 family RNA polymerase sigma factor [Plantibacter sp.]
MTASRRDARHVRLEALHQANAADLLSFIGRRVRTPADAADVLSETFVVAWRRVDRMPLDPERARMWLFGVARRTLANLHRSTARRDALTARFGEYLRTLPPDEPDDVSLEVRSAIADLPDDQAEIVRLVLWDGFAVIEAAQVLGIRESTARGRYQRARLRLREALGHTAPTGALRS